jgi:uncharacterized protein (TIGR02266 family)
MRDVDAREPRLTINQEFDSFDQFVREYVTNISKTGLFIKTPSPLPVGSVVNLAFTIVTDGIETVEGEAEVVRTSQNPPGMGVAFRALRPESRALVDRLLTEWGARSADG